LPAVLNMMRSDWFLLVLQQAETRHDEPVDVFLWDMRTGTQLLRGRVQPHGVLLSAHIAMKDANLRGATPGERSGTMADDCAIAAQIKQLAGTAAPTVEHVPAVTEQTPAPAAPGAATPAAEAQQTPKTP
jgi:hypothetical protein